MRRLRFTRKTGIILTVSIVILFGFVAYSYASVRAWGELGRRTELIQASSQKIFSQLDMADGSTEERRQTVASLTALGADQSLCQPDWWYGWQTFLPAASDQLNKCTKDTAQLKEVQSRSQVVSGFLDNEQQLVSLLVALAGDDKPLADAKWPVIKKTVTTTYQLTKKLEVTPEFEPVKRLAETRLAQLETTWKDLTAAHKAEDQSDYVKAVDALKVAYKRFSDIAPESEKRLETLLDSLQRER